MRPPTGLLELDQKIGLASSISTATTASHKTWLYTRTTTRLEPLEFLDSWLHIQPLLFFFSRSISSSNKLGSGHLNHRCGLDTKNKEVRWYCWTRPEDIEWKRRHVFVFFNNITKGTHKSPDSSSSPAARFGHQLRRLGLILILFWNNTTSATIRLNQPKQSILPNRPILLRYLHVKISGQEKNKTNPSLIKKKRQEWNQKGCGQTVSIWLSLFLRRADGSNGLQNKRIYWPLSLIVGNDIRR